MTMDRPSRTDRVLVGLLDELADARMPDYLEAAIERASDRAQRPAWTFPERWLPMADFASERLTTPRLPWRTIATALVTLALLAGILAIYVGSHQTRLPPPFGVAGNGLVAHSKDGDIYTVDPTTGTERAIVTGPETDLAPRFSPDGRSIAFLRAHGAGGGFDLVIVSADGSGARVISRDPLAVDATVEFAPDGSALFVSSQTGRIVRLDPTGATPARDLAVGRFLPGEVRPTDGRIVYENDLTPEIDLWVVEADGTGHRRIYDSGAPGDSAHLSQVRWSPDGSMIAFVCTAAPSHDRAHVCVMDADGSNVRRLTEASDDWWEVDFAWSPDSRRIAFNRWERTATSQGEIRPIGVATIGDPTVADAGPAPGTDGALFGWSPDGTTILSLPARFFGSPTGTTPARPVAIDIASGEAVEWPFEVASDVSWQRVALPD